MDFLDLREEKKKILTCYQTRNKHATSIMEKLLKKIKKKKFKNKIFTQEYVLFASSVFIVLLKKEKKNIIDCNYISYIFRRTTSVI